MKELTLTGFFLSEPGATQVLQYEAVPGAYHGFCHWRKQEMEKPGRLN